MPIAEDPDQRRPDPRNPTDRPSGPDPFEGLVLDEDFVKGATAQEGSARARMLAARWREEAPVDPGGRRWSPSDPVSAKASRWIDRRGKLALWVLCGLLLLAVAVGYSDFSPAHRGGRPIHNPVVGSTTDLALPGGGTSMGSACGAKGRHRHALPPFEPVGRIKGPQLVLTSYGSQRLSGDDPGAFEIDLAVAPGLVPLTLPASLGAEGVTVEIEGPDGLVAGGHHLPVTLVEGTTRTPDGGLAAPLGGTVRLDALALCPGQDLSRIGRGLSSPIDGHNTITGPPPYVLTLSFSHPAVATARAAAGSALRSDVLAADNLVREEDVTAFDDPSPTVPAAPVAANELA
ncbi:SCO2583/SCO2584 N-terminal domain-containing protein [Kitasatospora sp. NPDC004289]